MDKKRIVIIGGGFAGLKLLKRLDKKKFDVLLIDRNNYHSFPPLFYQIASSGLDPASICFPFRQQMIKERALGARFHLGEVKQIDTDAHTVTTQYETAPYDILIIAAGTTNNFFGNDTLASQVFTLKSPTEAMRCRYEALARLEQACLCKDHDERRRMLSFVVVGGGPAGVEMAGALGEMKRFILPREYKSLSPDDISITLLEGSPKVLGSMDESSSQAALKYLGELMVDVRLNHLLKSFDGTNITLDDDQQIPAGMVIWTAGITGVHIDFAGTGPIRTKGNRLAVDEFCAVQGIADVYAIGDIACMVTDEYPHGHPQLAQVAIQQGDILARNLNRGRDFRPFRYHDKGTMATVGRKLAVVDLPHMHIKGSVAWMIWMFIHLISILGMRNKLTVLINWIWAFFTYGTSLRLLFCLPKNPTIDSRDRNFL